MQAVAAEGRGVIVYLRQEGRGIGLINKIRAYALQDKGMDTVEANLALGLPVDARDFTLAKENLRPPRHPQHPPAHQQPRKVHTLQQAGIHITERLPLHVGIHPENQNYLNTKAQKLNHMMKD